MNKHCNKKGCAGCSHSEEPIPSPLQQLNAEFDKEFGIPVGDEVTVKMKKGSDTMLVSQKEIKAFLASRLPDIIKSVVERIVPEEKVEHHGTNYSWKDIGFNSCRQQILDNLEKLKI